MSTYYQQALLQKKKDYTNLIVPILGKTGHKLINYNHLRIMWGKDWNEFTVHTLNPSKAPTWPMDDLMHSIWNGTNVPNCPIATCYIKNKGVGPVTSLAITDLHTLADAMKRYGAEGKVKNTFNGMTFMKLPFSHPSLSNNIWGIGIKSF